MTTLTKQQVKANWHILEDYPRVDGDYVVCFLTTDGEYGWPDIWYFSAREGWEPVAGTDHADQPTHWCELPFPR
jgi:hypothetical protein